MAIETELELLKYRRTKIVATLGPASDDESTIARLIEAGVDVFRFNMSHGDHESHRRTYELVRRLGAAHGRRPTAVLFDLSGPKIRVGTVPNGRIPLVVDHEVTVTTRDVAGDETLIPSQYDALAADVKAGDRILLDDGALELEVEGASRRGVRCTVVRGGVLRDSKGVNVPAREMPFSAEDRRTREELAFAVEQRVDYIAASFVQGAQDVIAIRDILQELGAKIPIIAKIESRAAVANLDAIVEAADGTMVARGDLGVEFPFADVPAIQKTIIRTTVTNGKPVITATQMLDSMERNPRPTRAEVSDVANAILDGSSAVMLSGETAMGKYPVESVRTMSALAVRAEASLAEYGQLQKILPNPSNVVTEAVSQAAVAMAHHLNAAAIISLTETGFTSRLISKYRPNCPIVAVTSSVDVVRRFSMNWGVYALHYTGNSSDQDKVQFAILKAKEHGWVHDGDIVVATSGQTQQAGST
ncbi:MAG: pyruvate kinase, partial [Acidobacteriota bacterium]|nr:pyruvate kinase [Acidobacteriota bacterium]